MKKRLLIILIIVIFTAGLGILLYPLDGFRQDK